MKHLTVIDGTGGGGAIQFDFDRDMVDFIKESVPKFARRYDPDCKTWNLTNEYDIDQVLKHANGIGFKVSDRRRKTAKQQRCDTPQEWAVELFKAVGQDRVNVVYRALSKVLHPDVDTGDHDLMVALSNAKNKLGRD